MVGKDLQFLCCPRCKGDLRPLSEDGAKISAEHAAKLRCSKCDASYDVVEGIPILGPGDKDARVEVVVETFGRRWSENYRNMVHMQYAYAPSLLPITPQDFKDKVIIDAGCGFGPLTKYLLDSGAKHVICIDYSKAIFTAQHFLETYRDKITLVYGDILQPPIKPVADMFISHGVLIHVADGKKAYTELSRLIAPQKGTSVIWVYSKEKNGLLQCVLKAIRFVTLRLPWRLNWLLAFVLEFIMSLSIYLIYFPAEYFFKGGRKLWFGHYFLDFLYNPDKGGTRKYRYNMIHDALCTPIANHFSKEDLLSWVQQAQYRAWNFVFYRKQSWTVAASYMTRPWNQGAVEAR